MAPPSVASPPGTLVSQASSRGSVVTVIACSRLPVAPMSE